MHFNIEWNRLESRAIAGESPLHEKIKGIAVS